MSRNCNVLYRWWQERLFFKCDAPHPGTLTLTTLKYVCINHGDQRVFQFEVIIYVLVSSFRFIWIHMPWIYDHYKYIISFSVGIVFRRQILTFKDNPRTEMVYTLKVSNYISIILSVSWHRHNVVPHNVWNHVLVMSRWQIVYIWQL